MIDFWFNKMNSSSVVGGRVTTEFYTLKAQTNTFLIFLFGSNWAAEIYSKTSSSMFFHNLIGESGEIIPCSDVDMMYFWDSIQQDNNAHNFIVRIGNWNVLDFGITLGQMIGINTPQYVEPKTPNFPQNSFLNSLLVGMQQAVQRVSKFAADALGPALYYFGDSVFALFGMSGAYRTITTFMSSIWTGISSNLANMILLFTNLITLAGTVIGFVTFAADALGPALYYFGDSVFALFGMSGAYRTITTFMSSIWTGISSNLANMILLFTNLITLAGTVIGFVTFAAIYLTSAITSIISTTIGIINGTGYIGGVLAGSLTGLGNIWTTFNLGSAGTLALGAIVIIVGWLGHIDEKAREGANWLGTFISESEMYLGVFSKIAGFFLWLLDWIIDKITTFMTWVHTVIEAVPAVE